MSQKASAVKRAQQSEVRPHQLGQEVFKTILSEDVDWKPFPAFPPSVRLAVVVGQPSEPGPYTIRVKVPHGEKLMPHKHPEDRVYTVISGVFYIGLGDEFDASKLEAYPPGAVVILPGNTSHFHWAKSGEYVTQVTAMGPLGLEYLSAKDDPRNKQASIQVRGPTLIQTVGPKSRREERPVEHPTFYRTIQIDGLSIFYREAGPKDAPTLLLLHGLPSSSRMFEPLFARLSDRYHLVAPDYPGFGHSDWPDPKKFAYTFDHIAEIMNHFTEALGLSRYTLYMQDYGGPVGFRMALAHPERVEALIVQDAVAHNEGLGANWKTRRAFWADRAANESALRTNLLSLATTRTRHVGNDPNVERYDPDLWTDEFAFLSQPGQAEIQSDLFYDYRTNVDAYPKWQAWMREKQPRLLVIWGKYELSFDSSEPEAYRRDVPNAEVHIVDGGHFALDTAADEIAQFVRGFMSRESAAAV